MFSPLFSSRFSSHTAQVAEDENRDWENEVLPTAGEDGAQECQRNPKMPMGPGKIHPRVLREMADEAAEPLSILFENIAIY